MSELKPSQALLLFGLLARHGECPQAELMPKVTKADRDWLVKARLIEAKKVGRGLYLRLEDAGWAWAGGHLSAELPPAQRTLHDLLGRLAEHLARSDRTLADFIGGKPAEARPEARAAGRKRGKSVAAPDLLAPVDAKDAILRAYAELTGGRTGTDVPLTALRAGLPNLSREAFDAALAEMHLEFGKARLMRTENNRALSEADRAAAFHFKGNVFHHLWIEP